MTRRRPAQPLVAMLRRLAELEQASPEGVPVHQLMRRTSSAGLERVAQLRERGLLWTANPLWTSDQLAGTTLAGRQLLEEVQP
jgi:hypothetical protein